MGNAPAKAYTVSLRCVPTRPVVSCLSVTVTASDCCRAPRQEMYRETHERAAGADPAERCGLCARCSSAVAEQSRHHTRVFPTRRSVVAEPGASTISEFPRTCYHALEAPHGLSFRRHAHSAASHLACVQASFALDSSGRSPYPTKTELYKNQPFGCVGVPSPRRSSPLRASVTRMR